MSSSSLAPSYHLNLEPASSSYRLRAWLAILGLVLFFIFYIGIASWFTFITIRMIFGIAAGGKGAVAGFFTALTACFFAVFMWKAFFFVRRNKELPGVEIKPEDQPELFAFLHQLADQIGAPRVHRVFVTPEVNASVFYDLSILNFLLPTKKNLAIGLGLVNTLNRSEFTAVLAHEFGHFAQSTMAVGRWAHIGEQIASNIIGKRDALDAILRFIAGIDLRVAWIGWLMQAIVWSIRSVMETVFKWVLLAQRALMREMEFQADRVAVAVAGSDAIVHALYRLQPADEDWDATVQFLNQELRKGYGVRDPYQIHRRIGQHLRLITDEPKRGLSPISTRERVFEERLAQPPRMWLTHPSNTEREDHAKSNYVRGVEDSRESWTFFRNPSELRQAIGSFLLKDLKKQPEFLSDEEAIKRLDDDYVIPIHDTSYRGAYVGRKLTLSYPDASSLTSDGLPADEIHRAFPNLYSNALHQEVMRCRNLDEEVVMLESLHKGFLEAPAGIIRHRGRSLERSQLQEVIERVKQERSTAQQIIEQHDQRCRTVHDSASRYVGYGWPDYLASLRKLLHYAEHSLADISDASGYLGNQLAVQTATGRLGSSGRNKLVRAANDLHSSLSQLDLHASDIQLPQAILTELNIANWREAFPKLELPPATAENLHQWIPVIESWSMPMLLAFQSLQRAALNELLRSEKQVAANFLEDEEGETAPRAAVVPEQYPRRLRGKERVRQEKLDWWSRFVVADGKIASVARFVVTASIVAFIAIGGLFIGAATVIVHNGLSTPVKVKINSTTVEVPPNSRRHVDVGTAWSGRIETYGDDGQLIEKLEPSLGRGFATYVYNVAGASPLVQWTAAYGNAAAGPPVHLGCPKWSIAGADCIFEQPPVQLSTKSGGTTRSVLEAVPYSDPLITLSLAKSAEEAEEMVRIHSLWDSPNVRFTMNWLGMARSRPDFREILAERLKRNKFDLAALRAQYDSSNQEEQKRLTQEYVAIADSHPDNPDLQYLKFRTIPHAADHIEKTIAAYKASPDNFWLCNAAGRSYLRKGDFQSAEECFRKQIARKTPFYDHSTIELARLRRFQSKEPTPDLRDLKDSLPLEILLDTETGKNVFGTPLEGYYLLHQGKVAEARKIAEEKKDQRLLILCATSKGAEPAWLDEAFALSVDELTDGCTRMYLAALASRRGLPYEQYLEVEKEEERNELSRALRQKMQKWLNKKAQPSKSEFLKEDFKGLLPMERGILIQAWLLFAPDQSDESLQRAAKSLLFSQERPYLGDETPAKTEGLNTEGLN